MQRYLEYGSFSILPYAGTCTERNRKPFWEVFDKALGTKIIMVSYAALKSDAETYFNVPYKVNTRKISERLDPQRSIDPKIEPYTLFSRGRVYAVCAIDEAHYARTARMTRLAGGELVYLSRTSAGLTATPIVTSPMDVVLLAQMLHIPGFEGEEMNDFRKAYLRAKAREARNAKSRKQTVREFTAVTQGLLTSHANQSPSKEVLREWIAAIRERLVGYVIHRSVHSKDKDGDPIIKLDPWIEVFVPVELNDMEMEVQRKIANQLTADGARLNESGVELAARSNGGAERQTVGGPAAGGPWLRGSLNKGPPGGPTAHGKRAARWPGRGAT
ncbi:hypothetical protein OH77DRAFT_1440817, partial [Trametes cingulata]